MKRIAAVLFTLLGSVLIIEAVFAQSSSSPFYDYKQENPGTVRHITVKDLPKPFATRSANNEPVPASRPEGAMPKTLPGFKVEQYVSGLDVPRELRTAPNGDVFVAETHEGEIKVFRGVTKDGKPEVTSTFATGLFRPFGIAFYPPDNPQWVYIANTDSVKRFPYHAGDLKATGPAQTIIAEIFPGASHPEGHTTRDVVFSPDGSKMYVAVGSGSNIDDPDTNKTEFHRANILEYTPDGKFVKIFASGIRNPVQMALNPKTGELWTATNERDGLGNNLVPDYTTHVQEGGFYGWPWYYMGGNHDPRLPDSHPDLRAREITPDVLLQPHSAPLGFAFYNGNQFPSEYKGDEFLALHGSWNRDPRTGYMVVRVPLHGQGKSSGDYEDFLTGFVTADGNVWGRPVGIAVAKDGSLLVSDDGTGSIWRVSYQGK
ncbi:MAG TPA: sorbosone dehydrogenase family protein [Terriglobales bacterium]|nr:sorbosone dehydrogenase family protein [Terriglobales bacterium]